MHDEQTTDEWCQLYHCLLHTDTQTHTHTDTHAHNQFSAAEYITVSFSFAESRFAKCRVSFFPSFSFLIPFINAIQPFYGCQRNVCKNITVIVSVRVSATVRVSLVWRHRHFLFRKISKWHGFSAKWDLSKPVASQNDWGLLDTAAQGCWERNVKIWVHFGLAHW